MSLPIKTAPRTEIHPVLLDEVDGLVASALPRAKPVFLHMLGIPGSGKTSFVEVLVPELAKRPPVVVGFDRLMAVIPEYRDAMNREEAFNHYELPARAAGYFLLNELLVKRADILLDHGGSFPEHIDMLKYARDELGYRLIIVRMLTNAGTAKKRIEVRQDSEGRHTPVNYVDEREKIIGGLLKSYKNLTDYYFEILNEAEFEASGTLFSAECAQIAACWYQ